MFRPGCVFAQSFRDVVKRRYLKFVNLTGVRWTSQTTSADASEGEKRIAEILKKKFPQATTIAVTDISGGCGAMYEIMVESSEFQGIRTVLQHRQVHDALRDEIKAAHGVRIVTGVPER